MCRWPPGWMTPWAPWPRSWSTMLRLSPNSKENVWYHCSAALFTRVLSWRTAYTGGEWKSFIAVFPSPQNSNNVFCREWKLFVKVWLIFFLQSVGVLCLLVNARRCWKRPEQRTKSQSPALAFHQYPTSLWEHRSGWESLVYGRLRPGSSPLHLDIFVHSIELL